nr:hypothetical protein [Rubrobacter sp.]
MRGLVDFGFVGDHHEELLREAEERRLARHLWEARRSGSRSGAGGKRDKASRFGGGCAPMTRRWL